MKNRKIIYSIFAISACLSLGLGMLDRETESLVHLLNSDNGNIVALIFYTMLFAIFGFVVWGLIYLVGLLFKSKRT